MMKAFNNLVQLRVIAVLVCVGAAIPLFVLGGFEDPLREVLGGVLEHSALIIFLICVAVWVPWFARMRSQNSLGVRSYVMCGIALGVMPGLVYLLLNFLSDQPFATLGVVVAGILSGGFAGWAIWRLPRFGGCHMNDLRSDPDQLLATVNAEEAGVGKTYSMLEAARNVHRNAPPMSITIICIMRIKEAGNRVRRSARHPGNPRLLAWAKPVFGGLLWPIRRSLLAQFNLADASAKRKSAAHGARVREHASPTVCERQHVIESV